MWERKLLPRSSPILLLLLLLVFASDANRNRNRRNSVLDSTPAWWTSCRTIPGLSKAQQSLCYKYPDVTAIAMQGLEKAAEECQYQFKSHRWNCSSLHAKKRNPRGIVLFQKGYRESAFSYAIASAGVTYMVARACSAGLLTSCGCESRNSQFLERHSFLTPEQILKRADVSPYQWNGCSHNMDFSLQFANSFLDGDEKDSTDTLSRMKRHNSLAGRLAVTTQMEVKCKCHGLSGSCNMKTCWRSTPDFRKVGDALKARFRDAVLVDQMNYQGNGLQPVAERYALERRRRSRYHRASKKKRKREPDSQEESLKLVYYEKSPNFCERDPNADFPGTSGRQCNRNSTDNDNCESLCCDRGYTLVKQRVVKQCKCKFVWCCYVVCEECVEQDYVAVCN